MKKTRRLLALCIGLSLCLTIIPSIYTYAKSRVGLVSLQFDVQKDGIPDGTPYPAEIFVLPYSVYEITECSWSKPYEKWKAGEKVNATVSLNVKEEYKEEWEFKDLSVSCSYADVTSKKANGDTATIKLAYIPSVKLPQPKNVRWDPKNDGYAKWDKVKNATTYRVDIMVYDEESEKWRVDGYEKTESNTCNLTSYILENEEREMTFRVKAIGNSAYAEDSEYVMCEDEMELGETTISGNVQVTSSGTTAVNEDGKPATGWQQLIGGWYYFNTKGTALTGWNYINNAWYYFDQTGLMQTGWQKIGGIWYFLNDSGAMQTGWLQDGPGGIWYYMDQTGAMTKGWNLVDGYWYYFDASGRMLHDTITPDGYRVDGFGRWMP